MLEMGRAQGLHTNSCRAPTCQSGELGLWLDELAFLMSPKLLEKNYPSIQRVLLLKSAVQTDVRFLQQAVNTFVSAVKILFFWFGVFVLSGTFGARLKRTLNKLQIWALSYCPIFSDIQCVTYIIEYNSVTLPIWFWSLKISFQLI